MKGLGASTAGALLMILERTAEKPDRRRRAPAQTPS